MPNHEARIKPIVAEQKKKKNSTIRQADVLSAQPSAQTDMPVSEDVQQTTAGSQEKAKAYLVDYLAKNGSTSPGNTAAQPKDAIASSRYKEKTTGEQTEAIVEKEDVKANDKPGLKFLDPATTQNVVDQKLKKVKHLAKATSTTKKAAVKIAETEKSQDKPEAEQHSDSNETQVGSFAGQPVPEKSKTASVNALHKAIDKVVPHTLGDLKDFKKEGKGKHISNAVMEQVGGDVGSVKQGFAGMGQTPAPTPAEKGNSLPEPEKAESIGHIDMGSGIVPQLQPEHLDTKQYLNQAEDIYKKEEVNKEDLEEVTSGELAEAKEGMQTLKKDAVGEPAALKAEAETERKKLHGDMEKDEKEVRQHMLKDRGGKLKATGEKQKTTKTKLEKEREAVASNINAKFETCQKSILSQLADLETKSLKRFDDGQAAATVVFEDQVNNDIEEFKRKRYDTDILTRGYRKIHDWLLGIDGFPEVKNAFTRAKDTFVKTIDRLIGEITADNNKVINACKKQLQDTRKEIADYVKGLKGTLQKAGKQALGEITEKLKQLGEEIEQRKEKLQQQLADKRQAAMKAIDDKIAKMKEKLSGAVAKLGRLLADWALKAFKWACNFLGLDAEKILSALRRAGQAFVSIIKHVRKFFGNLKDSVSGAIDNFTANAKAYMGEILINWLTGAMGTAIVFPKIMDAKGVLSIIMQVAHISKEYIRKKLVSIFGEEKLRKAEQSLAPVKLLLSGDIMGLWEWIKDRAQGLMTAFIESVKDWLFTRLILGLGKFIVSLFLPGGGLIKAVQAIYKLVMWFVNNIQRIIVWVNSVLDSFSNIANSAIAAAIKTIVAAMKQIMVIVLDFFATILNVGKISQEIKKIIDKIVQPIHDAIDKFIAWIKDKIKSLFGKGDKKKDEKGAAQHDPEKKKKIDAGIIDLRKEQDKVEHNDKITHGEAEQVAKTIKGRHSVFSKLYVVDGSDSWNYKYAASPEVEIEGDKKAEGSEATRIVYRNNHVVADPLTKNRKTGSGTIDIPGWSHAQILNANKPDIYVKGHMLSQALSGDGHLQNLSIITKKVNTAMSNGPEQAAKGKTANGEILKYEVKWTNHPDNDEIKNFANEINVYVYEKKEGVTVLFRHYPFNELPQPADTAEGQVLNLNDFGRAVIEKQFKVNEGFARDLVAERDGPRKKFESLLKIEERMRKYYNEKGSENKGGVYLEKQLEILEAAIINSKGKLTVK